MVLRNSEKQSLWVSLRVTLPRFLANDCLIKEFIKRWCPEEDSNLHALRRWYLKPVRLPIPPSGPKSMEGDVKKPKDGVNGLFK